jgi:hypothetical protein
METGHRARRIRASGGNKNTVPRSNASGQAKPRANNAGCTRRRTSATFVGRSMWIEYNDGDVLIRNTGGRKEITNALRYKM